MKNWRTEKLGMNLCIFRSINPTDEKETYSIIFEYDFDLHRFKVYSDYGYCKRFTYRNRVYKRDLPNNRRLFTKLSSSIPVTVWQEANALFE